MPQPSETAADRSRQLIEAASGLLWEAGLEGLTIRAVLKRTGLARRAFYERFAGKDDLVLALFAETFQKTARLFRSETEAIEQPIEKIHHVVEKLVLGALDNHDDRFGEKHVSAMVHEHLRLAQMRPAELQRALEPFIAFLAEQIAAGVERGELRACDPILQATLIYNLVATTLHAELMLRDTVDCADRRKEQLAEDLWEFCRRAIIA